jgi:DNA-binding transcriptional regulator YiaG
MILASRRRPGDPLGDAFAVARLLVQAGVSVRIAKKTLEDLSAGKSAFVHAPKVASYDTLRRRLAEHKIGVYQVKLYDIDVKALRVRLGMSQEAFAGHYGLDVATVRNWEQGRTKPEGPAAALLQLIDRDPEKIASLLAS